MKWEIRLEIRWGGVYEFVYDRIYIYINNLVLEGGGGGVGWSLDFVYNRIYL